MLFRSIFCRSELVVVSGLLSSGIVCIDPGELRSDEAGEEATCAGKSCVGGLARRGRQEERAESRESWGRQKPGAEAA